MLRRLVLALALLMLLGAPAAAGGPEAPEVADDCGVGTIDEDGPLTPWTDVCAAWLETGGGSVTAVIQLAADVAERPNPSVYWLSWTTADGCTHTVSQGDRQLSNHVPNPPNVHRSGGEGYRSFSARCPEGGAEAYIRLDEAAVVEDGATIRFTFDVGVLEQAHGAVAAQYSAGQTLRALTASTGVDCEVCLIYSDTTQPGRDHVIGSG